MLNFTSKMTNANNLGELNEIKEYTFYSVHINSAILRYSRNNNKYPTPFYTVSFWAVLKNP